VRVVTTLEHLSAPRLCYEKVGCWGLPLLIAYVLWRYSSAFPPSILDYWLMVLGEGMSARFHRQRRCLHDPGTYVVNAIVPLYPTWEL